MNVNLITTATMPCSVTTENVSIHVYLEILVQQMLNVSVTTIEPVVDVLWVMKEIRSVDVNALNVTPIMIVQIAECV